MQYLLSQEEMDKARSEAELLRKLPTIEKLQKFCTFVSDNMVLTDGWRKGSAWGCILSQENRRDWYCDDCPARQICPYPGKEFSK